MTPDPSLEPAPEPQPGDTILIPPGFQHTVTQIFANSWDDWDQLLSDPHWEVRDNGAYAESAEWDQGHLLLAHAPLKPRPHPGQTVLPVGPEDFDG